MLIFLVSSILICIIMVIFMFIKSKENHLSIHNLQFDSFPKSFGTINMLFISDIHRRIVSDRLLEQVSTKIDFVVIGGDLTEKGVPFHRVESNIQRLKKVAPVYFVFGNNDYEVGKNELEQILLKNGVKLLNNTSATLSSQTGEVLELLGVEDMSEERDRLDLALKSSTKNSFKILISHNPDIHQKVLKKDGISLILSGHTHGGQIRLFGFGLYEKGKIHYLKNTIILISNGYGTSGIPLRLGAPAEAHMIQFTSEQNDGS